MNRIRTVLGDVPAADITGVDAHDHLFLDVGLAGKRTEMLLTSADEVHDELSAYRAAGGGAVVCATPIGLGRQPEALAEASRASGVAVIATSGFHKSSYYAPTHWSNSYPLTTIADLVRADVVEGIDRYDYSGPVVDRTGVRAGLVKAGGDYHRFAGRERDLHRVAAEVALDTGVALLLHVEHGAEAHAQLDVVTATGLPPGRVLVSHLDRNPDPAMHLTVARRGAYLVYDGLYREKYRPQSVLVDLFAHLADGMCLDRLLVGADLAPRAYRRAGGAPGLAGLFTHLVPRLRERLGERATEQILTHNARRALALAAPTTQESP